MRWPWASNTPERDDRKPSRASSVTDVEWARYKDPRNLVPVVVLTGTSLILVRFYKSYLRRIPTVEHIRPQEFRKRSLLGKVTSVGDGDNFRLFHTPGGRLTGWGWLPGRSVPTKRDGLASNTIHIRIAGIDAPELAHFGRPAQPYGAEALRWISAYLLHRRVRARIHRRDQYDRVVATVSVRRWGVFRRDVGREMLRQGLATVYEAKTGSEFGGFEKAYREAEGEAKRAKRGMWAEPGLLARMLGERKKVEESPRQFKDRMTARDREKGKEQSSGGSPKR